MSLSLCCSLYLNNFIVGTKLRYQLLNLNYSTILDKLISIGCKIISFSSLYYQPQVHAYVILCTNINPFRIVPYLLANYSMILNVDWNICPHSTQIVNSHITWLISGISDGPTLVQTSWILTLLTLLFALIVDISVFCSFLCSSHSHSQPSIADLWN